MTELPRKAGRYHVAKHIMLYVPPLGRPWFEIRVSYTRDFDTQQLFRKLYVNVLADYQQQLDDARLEAGKMYREVRKRSEVYAKALLDSLMKQKQEQLQADQEQRNERTEMARNQARKDVQQVWAFYGPVINMRKPFFIQQWI